MKWYRRVHSCAKTSAQNTDAKLEAAAVRTCAPKDDVQKQEMTTTGNYTPNGNNSTSRTDINTRVFFYDFNETSYMCDIVNVCTRAFPRE